MEPKSGKIIDEIWMNFGTCLDAIFGGVSAVLAARIEPQGVAKEEAETTRKEKIQFA